MAEFSRIAFGMVVLAMAASGAAIPRQANAQTAGAKPMFACEDAYEGGKRSDFFNTPVYQGKDGWFFRYSADLSDTQIISPDAVARVAEISDILKKRGTTLVYMPVPTRGLGGSQYVPAKVADGVLYDPELALRSHQSHVEAFRKAGVVAIDLASALTKDPPKDRLFMARDFHWTSEGARWAAMQVRRTLDGLAEYAAIVKTKFETAPLGPQRYTSKMYGALAVVCGSGEGLAETVNGYETKRGSATADDLLGEAGNEVAPVALVGTSFSDNRSFNFEGFLSQALESEVANFAVSGGGQFSALYKWLLTEGQKDQLPKFLLWELPIYNRLDDGQYLIMFRQMLAAAHGPCAKTGKVLSDAKISLSVNGSKRVEFPASLKLRGEDVALRFHEDGQNLQALGLEMEYSDGESELLNLRQPERVGTMDTFEFALDDDIDGDLTALSVRNMTGTALNLSLEVCNFHGDQQ